MAARAQEPKCWRSFFFLDEGLWVRREGAQKNLHETTDLEYWLHSVEIEAALRILRYNDEKGACIQ